MYTLSEHCFGAIFLTFLITEGGIDRTSINNGLNYSCHLRIATILLLIWENFKDHWTTFGWGHEFIHTVSQDFFLLKSNHELGSFQLVVSESRKDTLRLLF